MKFRVTSKDLLIFCIFCILLLYLCSIGIVNISYFGSTGQFYGLNPFMGFTSKYLPATLLLFIVFIVIIFSSVSSYIFDKEKGSGFGLKIGDKDNKGYSRWAKEKEIKADKGVEMVHPTDTDIKAAGIPLINNGKEMWVDNGEYHNLIIGATGSGKSATIVKPMVNLLIKKGESMIITDPKGELYVDSAEYLKQNGYKIIVLNFREPGNGNAWNPLTLPYQYYHENNRDKATELLDDVALNILSDPSGKSDPFWEKSAADYFSGLSLGLFEDAKEEEINLNSINYMSTVGEDKFPPSNFIKEYFNMKGESSNAYVFASNTINSPNETKGGILSVFRQKIRLFASREQLSEMLSHSDFDMKKIGEEKTAVFIIIHDEKTTYHSLATIFIKQCYESLVDVAQKNGGKLPIRTNFILDEFANMPQLRDVTTMVTAARSRDIKFTFIIQNFAQLKAVYGPENAETIKGNCGNLVYLISTELAALEEISKMCGDVKSSDKEKTTSTPLVTVTDLQKLKLFEAIIIRWRLSPFKTKYTPNFEMDWGYKIIPATYPKREEQEVKLFDLKTFVKEKKREKMLSSLESDDSKKMNNPFDNPFASKPSGFDNPFEMNTPINPFEKKENTNPLGGGLDFNNLNLDEMMKDIDRKIAELDAQEAAEKAKLTTGDTPLIKPATEVPEPIFNQNKKDTEYNIYNKTEKKDVVKIPKDLDLFANILTEEPKKEEHAIETPKSNPPKVEIPKIEEAANIELRPTIEPLEEEVNYITPTKEIIEEHKKDLEETTELPKIKEEIPKIQEVPEIEEKAKVNVNPDNIDVEENIVSDDEFFDDFFGDD